MEVDVEIEGTSESLNQRDCTGAGRRAAKACFLDQVRRNATVDDVEHFAHDRRTASSGGAGAAVSGNSSPLFCSSGIIRRQNQPLCERLEDLLRLVRANLFATPYSVTRKRNAKRARTDDQPELGNAEMALS
jgi:hypothetical protein